MPSIFNKSINANSVFFDSMEAIKYGKTKIVMIYCTCDTSGILTLKRTNFGSSVYEKLNSGYPLIANCAYAFDIPVDSDEIINLQYSVNTTVLKAVII